MDFILLSIHCHKLRNFATNYLDIEKPASQTSDSSQVTCFACELFVVARISVCQFVLYFSKYYLLLYGHCGLRSILCCFYCSLFWYNYSIDIVFHTHCTSTHLQFFFYLILMS